MARSAQPGKRFKVLATLVYPQPYTGMKATGSGSSIRVATERASSLVSETLSKKNVGTVQIRFEIVERPTARKKIAPNPGAIGTAVAEATARELRGEPRW